MASLNGKLNALGSLNGLPLASEQLLSESGPEMGEARIALTSLSTSVGEIALEGEHVAENCVPSTAPPTGASSRRGVQ